MSRKFSAGACLFVFALIFGGCSSPGGPILISPQVAAIGPGASELFAISAGPSNIGVIWSVNAIPGGNSTVGTISSQGEYTAPPVTAGFAATVTATTTADPSQSVSASVIVIAPGQVTSTANPQVALYTISPPAAANVSVEFGTDTGYGLTTWAQPAPAGGGAVNLFVAGMRASTSYHMRAIVQFAGGLQFADADHVFTTGTLPPNQLPPWTATTTQGLTPQPGVELINLSDNGTFTQAAAIDLAGNVLWTYTYTGSTTDQIQPIKMLPNGHFLVSIGPASSDALNSTQVLPGTINVIREIDLAGDTVQELSTDTLNMRLAAAGFNLVVDTMHHDVEPLPNGHWIVICNTTQQFTDLPGYLGVTTVLGDVLVDLDTNLNPVWIWSTFDHLDVNRHPMNFPDWTHSNAVLYSASDGDLVLSMRHQNWILKIDYNNGQGAGDIVWHLGEGGDFTLQNGNDPVDWFYAQHKPSFVTPNTSGKFSLAVFDNGDDREFASGVTCGASGAPPCLYSTVPIFDLDETAKTATLVFHDVLAPAYSFFGGNAEVLANGNVEFDECAVSATSPAVAVYEVTQTATPQTVWQLNIQSSYAYRVFRMPSLYPGVQW
jgi:hypothetical protein